MSHAESTARKLVHSLRRGCRREWNGDEPGRRVRRDLGAKDTRREASNDSHGGTPMAHAKKHGQAKRKHKKNPAGQHRKRHAKRPGTRHTKATRGASRRTAHARRAKAAHKCVMCGHSDRHDHKAGCTHFDGKQFCPCRHRG